ncbi:hypothetical protein P9139_17000 [Curtobacterium flaccumfaciens]|nr:hypothetical protein P9139_17000 [Curtobacterium flaccumfaciens]
MVWVVFAVLFAYMTVQSVGNLVTVSQSVRAFNEFLGSTSGGAPSRAAPRGSGSCSTSRSLRSPSASRSG